MLKVVSFKICPFVQRVTALLEARKVPYEIEYISLKDKPQWFLEISPHGQVPVLITESGQSLFESDAIVEYIDEVYPLKDSAMTPEQRAEDRAWSYLAAKHYLVQCSTQRSADSEALEERTAKLNKAFSAVEDKLGKTRYFSGDAVGRVDIAWLPILHRAAIIEAHRGYDFLRDFPNTKAWQQQLLATGLAEKSVASDFEQAFTDFYLSNDTYLGQCGDVCIGKEQGPSNADQACASGACC